MTTSPAWPTGCCSASASTSRSGGLGRSPTVAAILFVDIDHFKAVNDTYGHQVGDQLLVAVAGRLSGLLRTGDTLARPSGDEFILLCEGLDDRSQASKVAKRIGAAFTTPFVLSDTSVTVTASVGIAFAGRGDTIPERLLEDADAAMYKAKRLGGARHQVKYAYADSDRLGLQQAGGLPTVDI